MPTVYSPPVSTYVALQTVTLGANAASVTFSSIPATYRDLVIVINGKLDSLGGVAMEITFNGDTTLSNYSTVQMSGFGGASTSSTTSNTPEFIMHNSQGSNILQIMDYSATDKHKTLLVRDNAGRVRAAAIRWANTSAITSIKIGDQPHAIDLFAGTVISIYGIEA